MDRNIATPHIVCQKHKIAQTVIMPGDPNRSKFIAQTFLENPKLVNNVRGVQGWTGTYKGKRVTVMAHGMGNPSMGIYCHELYSEFSVQKIIRVGSCGALKEQIKLGEVLIASDVYTDTNYERLYSRRMRHLTATPKLQEEAEKKAVELGLYCFLGAIYNTDTFYSDEGNKQVRRHGCIGIEMESAALYYNAKKFGREALVLCSVSDNIATGEELSAEERENTFKNMMILALELA